MPKPLKRHVFMISEEDREWLAAEAAKQEVSLSFIVRLAILRLRGVNGPRVERTAQDLPF